MEDKHLTSEEIALYAEALQYNRKEKVPQAIRDHVKNCDACAEEVISVQEIIARHNVDSKKKTNKLARIKAVRWVPVAAGLTLLIGIGGYLLFYNQSQVPESTPQKIIAAMDSIEMEKKYTGDTTMGEDTLTTRENEPPKTQEPGEKLIAAAYEPHPRFEMLANRYKDAGFRGEAVKVKQENIIKVLPNKPLELSWINPSGKQLTVEIYDNKGNRIKEAVTAEESVTIGSGLDRGLFYWKLFNAEFDLLFCGKIRVE